MRTVTTTKLTARRRRSERALGTVLSPAADGDSTVTRAQRHPQLSHERSRPLIAATPPFFLSFSLHNFPEALAQRGGKHADLEVRFAPPHRSGWVGEFCRFLRALKARRQTHNVAVVPRCKRGGDVDGKRAQREDDGARRLDCFDVARNGCQHVRAPRNRLASFALEKLRALDLRERESASASEGEDKTTRACECKGASLTSRAQPAAEGEDDTARASPRSTHQEIERSMLLRELVAERRKERDRGDVDLRPTLRADDPQLRGAVRAVELLQALLVACAELGVGARQLVVGMLEAGEARRKRRGEMRACIRAWLAAALRGRTHR